MKSTILFFALLLSLAANRLQAQTYWITPTNTAATAFPWNGATNWSSGIAPSATDAVVIFTNFPGSQPAVNTTNVVSGGTNTPFIFGTLVCSNSQVLNGGQLNAAVSAGTPTIYVGSGTLWLYPLLGGTQGFNKAGAGEVTFRYNNNNNPFTGNIIISGGDLCLNIDSNLGNTNNDLVISNNAKLLINPTTLAPVTLSPARSVTLTCAAANFDVAGTNWLTIPGVINESVSGQGGLQKTDSGTLALSGVNIFGGGTTVSGGVLDCQTNAALGKGGATINSGGELACDANVILTNALTLAGGTVSFNGSGGAFAGPVTLNNDSTVALRSFLTGAAASGAISNAITDTANTLTVAGAGTLTFASGANSSTINMLRLTNSTAILASGTLNINTGGTPGNTTVTGGSGFNNFGGSTFTVNGGTLALAGNYFIPAGNSGGGNNVFTLQSGNVNNSGGEVLLAYAANGTLNVNGGTFNNQSQSIRVQQGATGVVNLNGGVLALNQFDNAGGTGGMVNFNGGTLRANVNGASLLQSHNSYVVKTSGAVMDSQSYAVSVDVPLVSGSSPDGGLKKVGSGTLTLTATNSYNGPTTISAGTLALGANALITGSSNLLMNSNSTLIFALNAPSGPTNIVVNGNVTLAGQINVSDSGIVANSVYPVIYYTGNLTNNGVAVAPLSPWAFTIDTSVPHVVRLLVGTKYPLFQLTNSNFAVSTLTTNLGGILHGAPALPLWYEVRDQTNRLWDYGATPAVSPWSITVRHLRAGTNTVTVFAKDTIGNVTSNSVQLTLALGANTPVRPRPQPAEVWWGGSCHDNIYNNGTIVGTYSRMSQLLQTNGWDFCKRYQDGFFLHGYVWVNQAAQMTNWQQVGQSISSQLAPFNGKYWLEDAWHAAASNMNYGVSSASGQAGNSDMLLGVGFALSEVTQDFNADWGDFCNWHPDWPTNDIRVLITGNTNQASAAYPYASGQWRDYANSYHAARPNTKFGWTWSPVWWHWQNGASLGNDSGIFTVTSNGTNYNFNWDFYNFMNDAVVAGSQAGVPFAFASDCPWEYYMEYPGNPGGWTQAQQLANRVKIRNYEAWLQNQNLRHTMICNSYSMNSSDTNASDLNYEARSLAVMYLHQQEGGRAWRYSFESWYEGPYTVVPETKAGSYTHLAMSAIKYIKGIADTNGTQEQLSLNLLTTGTVTTVSLQNNGDVACLPAVLAFESGNPATVVQYANAAGANITAQILSAEGYAHTNLLQPGQSTTLTITVQGNAAAQSKTVTLEAFWNSQDPTGIVRDRLSVAVPVIFGATNTYVWTNTASGNWSTSLNWSNNFAPTTNGSENCTVRFLGSGGYNASNNLAGQFTVNVLEANSATANSVNGNPLHFAASTPAGVSPQLNQNGAGAFTLSNPLTLDADLSFNAAGGGGVTLAGAIGGGGGLIKNGSHTVTLTTGNTFSGFTRINSGTLQTGDGTNNGVIPDGLVTNNATLRFLVASNTTQVFNGTLTGSGSLQKQGSGVLILGGSNTFTGAVNIGGAGVNGGGLRITNGSALGTGAGVTAIGGGTSDARLELAGGIIVPESLALAQDAGVIVQILNVSGSNTLSGSVALNGGGNTWTIESDAGRLTFTGNFTNTAGGFGRPLQIQGDGDGEFAGLLADNTLNWLLLKKYGLGTWTISGAATLPQGLQVFQGTMLVNGSVNPGTNAGSVTVSGGTLGGNGTLLGPVTIQSGGVLAPGVGGICALTVSNVLTLQAGGTSLFEISKTGLTNDSVRGLQKVVYGGTLVVTNLAGNLSTNDSFQLFAATNYSGGFATLVLPPLNPGLAWTNRLLLDGSLAVVAAPVTPPKLAFSLTSSNTLWFNWTNGALNFILQAQTNSLSVGLGANWQDYPGGSNPPVNVPLNQTNGSVMLRLISR